MLNLIWEEAAKGNKEQHYIQEQGVLQTYWLEQLCSPGLQIKTTKVNSCGYLVSQILSGLLEMSHWHSCNAGKEPGQDCQGFQH